MAICKSGEHVGPKGTCVKGKSCATIKTCPARCRVSKTTCRDFHHRQALLHKRGYKAAPVSSIKYPSGLKVMEGARRRRRHSR